MTEFGKTKFTPRVCGSVRELHFDVSGIYRDFPNVYVNMLVALMAMSTLSVFVFFFGIFLFSVANIFGSYLIATKDTTTCFNIHHSPQTYLDH
jgi:hypothetical protein